MIRKYRSDQHFLIDRRVLSRIIDYASIKSSDTVLEIGAGYGNLTELISEKAGHVIAIEIDPFLSEQLKNRFSGSNVEIIRGNALKIDFPHFNKVVANLPYSASSGITFKLLKRKFEYGILMYQYEFAKRMIARQGSKEYGRLSVTAQYFARMELLETVPKTAFSPRPKVTSAIIRLTPEQAQYKVSNEDFFMKFLVASFSQRRKKIRNAIINNSTILGIGEVVSALNSLPPDVLDKRAEVLSPSELAEIANNIWETREGIKQFKK